MSNRLNPHKLIVTILKKGMARAVVQAAKQAGARGATVILGRGTGIHERKFLGIHWNPEKEVVLTLVPDDQVQPIFGCRRPSRQAEQTGDRDRFCPGYEKNRRDGHSSEIRRPL